MTQPSLDHSVAAEKEGKADGGLRLGIVGVTAASRGQVRGAHAVHAADRGLREGNIVVFLEVRYRKSQEFGGAMQSIGSQKRERLLKAASLFLQSRPEFARNACRFDVMAIAGSAQQPDINWQRNAFEAC